MNRINLPYVAPLIAARQAGKGSDHMHLGYWPHRPDPRPNQPPDAVEWATAQARLVDLVLDAAALKDGHRIADLACGLGGTTRAIQRRVQPGALIALNIDAAQLALCPGSALRIVADASALPLAPGSLDRAICLEAAFHFPSRAAFLDGVARALRPGGRLVLADILLDGTPLTTIERTRIETALRRDFGTWPDPWVTPHMVDSQIVSAGFRIDHVRDITAETSPSFGVVAPGPLPPLDRASGPQVLKYMQTNGLLKYLLRGAVRME